MKHTQLSSAVALALSISAAPAVMAHDHMDKEKDMDKKAEKSTMHDKSHMQKQKDYKASDLSAYDEGDAIVLSGKILEVSDDEIVLGYGDRKVEVEFDEWPWEEVDMETMFKKGERVTVSGTVDKEWFSNNEIEANNIYLDDQYVYYFLNDTTPAYYIETVKLDSQSADKMSNKMNDRSMKNLGDGAFFSASGEITSVDGREFTLKTKNQKINVDTESLSKNPLDNSGLQQLAVGDRVYVYGEIDDKFYDDRELSADSIITLKDAREMRTKGEIATN